MSELSPGSERRSFENGLQFAWDSTSVELAQTCLRKYYYSMIRQIRPKNKSVHLIFGGIYASALEQFYKLRAEGLTIEDSLRSVVHQALKDSWSQESSTPIPFDDPKKTRTALIRTIIWYVEQFGDETEFNIKTYHLSDGKPAVEFSFALEVSDDIVLTGHLDRVVEFGDQLYVMDQKTTGGTVGPYYFDTFKMSNQMSQYTFAGSTVLHQPVSGVIIDAAQIMVNGTRFERGYTTRTKKEIQEWFEGTVHTINTAREATARNFFPQNRTACGNYGGCPFKLLCTVDPSIRESYIKTDYVSHVWDPLKAR